MQKQAEEKVKRQVLDEKVSDFIDNAEKFQIGKMMRSDDDDMADLDKKAILAHFAVGAQNKKGVFPYNRFVKSGSRPFASIVSPDEEVEKDCIVWCSNHYLGFNRDPETIKAAHAALDEYGTGCGTSAVSGGFSAIHKELEAVISKMVGKPETVLYSTGFTTNLGALGCLAGKGDVILIDRDSHASIIDGAKMSGAELRVYKHNDPAHLEEILKKIDRKKHKNVFVVTETVFSMSGEEAPLAEYCSLRKKYGFYLYVDEAHAFGFYGKKGAGLTEHLSLTNEVDFIMSTLSKATASIGGFVSADKHYCSYLRINSNPYLFQASIPPADAAVVLSALRGIAADRSRVERLWSNTKLMRSLLKESGFNVGNSKSPIVPLYVADETKLALLCKGLFWEGIFTNWVSYPVVSKNQGRLRFVVTASHTEEQIRKTVNVLLDLGRKTGII